MTDITPIVIQPIYPRPEACAMPPSTLKQARRLCVHESPESGLRPIRLTGGVGAGRQLLDHLTRLAADLHTAHFFLRHDLDPIQLQGLLSALGRKPTALRLSIGCTVDDALTAEILPGDGAGAIVQIGWRLTGPPPALGLFKAFSRAGIWNHLRLAGKDASAENCRTAALQPNIVHSWTVTGGDAATSPVDQAYGRVRPLPGRPLWQVVDDPVDRFLLADCLTKNRFFRLRVADDGEQLFTVGDRLEYHFVPPDRLPIGYLDEICAMVSAGGTVAATYVRTNLQRAHLIGYVTEQGVIVGNSSLKNPRSEYIASVKGQSGLDLDGYVERGYTSVRPEYRGLGIGTRLLEGLTARAGERRIFSVISEDNTATQIIARRNRTRKVATYFSEKAGKRVGIWMPEWMIENSHRGED